MPNVSEYVRTTGHERQSYTDHPLAIFTPELN